MDLCLRNSIFDEEFSDFELEVDIHPEANFTKVKESIKNYNPRYNFVYSNLLVDFQVKA